MSLVFNERTKLLASALNTAATSCFTVGIATPIAGYIYNVGNVQATLRPVILLLAAFGWLSAAVLLHLIARWVLGSLKP